MAGVGGIVNCSAENVEQARIDSRADLSTTPVIEFLGISSFEITHAMNAQLPKIPGDAFSNPRNLLQLLE
jgi:hypothetical protein